MRRPWHRLAGSLVIHAVLLAGAAVMLLPFVWMVATSLKPPHEIFQAEISFWPGTWHAATNYGDALGKVALVRFMINGAVVCAGIIVLQVTIAAPCAYALAKLEFRGRGLLFGAVLIAILIPIQVPSVPIYVGLAGLGLLDSYAALILPFSASAFAVFLLRQFFKAFPDEIIAAARLDGLSELEIVWRIVLPSAWPAVGALAVFSFVYHWNDLYWPLIVVMSPELATPPLGLVFFRNEENVSDFGALMAATTIVTAPLVIAFLLAQRRFIQGLTMAGMK